MVVALAVYSLLGFDGLLDSTIAYLPSLAYSFAQWKFRYEQLWMYDVVIDVNSYCISYSAASSVCVNRH